MESTEKIDTHEMDKAEQEYLRAKEIYEQLTACVSDRYASDLADTCETLGELYENMGKPEQAAAEYVRAEELQNN